MAKLTLDIVPEIDFSLAGIFSHEKDYRLCWVLNRHMEWELERKKDFLSSKEIKHTGFSFFTYENFEEDFLISVIKNAGNFSSLIPEQKAVDFLLLIKGTLRDEIENFVQKIKTIPLIVSVQEISVEDLKENTKSKLIFENYKENEAD